MISECGSIDLWVFREVEVGVGKLSEKISIEINFAQNHPWSHLYYLSVWDFVELVFFGIGNVDDVVRYFSEKHEHDGIGQDEQNAGVEGKNDDDFFPEAKLDKPNFESLEARFFLDRISHTDILYCYNETW